MNYCSWYQLTGFYLPYVNLRNTEDDWQIRVWMVILELSPFDLHLIFWKFSKLALVVRPAVDYSDMSELSIDFKSQCQTLSKMMFSGMKNEYLMSKP